MHYKIGRAIKDFFEIFGLCIVVLWALIGGAMAAILMAALVLGMLLVMLSPFMLILGALYLLLSPPF